MSRRAKGFVKERKLNSSTPATAMSAKSEFFTKFPTHSQVFSGLFPSCARWTISGSVRQTKLTSSREEPRPKEKRISEFAWAGLPTATITCEGSNEPEEQAEPLEAQMPSMSNPARSAMLSAPPTTKETVLA